MVDPFNGSRNRLVGNYSARNREPIYGFRRVAVAVPRRVPCCDGCKKEKKKKGEKMRMHRALRVLRPVLLWMLNRPRDYAADFKYACPIPTDADRLRENVHLCLSRAKLGYALGSPCRARDQWRPRASLFGKFCFHERDTNWIGGIRVGWFLEMKRTGKLVLVREWNYLRNIYMFSPFLGRDV